MIKNKTLILSVHSAGASDLLKIKYENLRMAIN